MSSLSTLIPGYWPHVVRAVTISVFVTFLVVLGFLVPFWIVLLVAAGMSTAAKVVQAFRAAARKVDRIIAEEVG